MSTQIQISPKSGITVGTTAVTSGTIGRVFFQGTGNVVQQDASFLFDGTNKTLTNYGKGAVTTNTSFGLQVFQAGTGAGTQNTAIGWGAANYLTSGSNNTMVGYRAGGGVLASNFTGSNNTLIGNSSGLYLSSGIQNTFVGNNTGTSITTGSYNTIIGHYTGSLSATLAQNVIISDGAGAVSLWKNGSHFNGFGYNPLTDTLGAKLDVKAQGALSTDIAFRVRNSADSATIGYIAGNGLIVLGENASTAPTVLVNPSSSTRLLLRGGTNQDLSFFSSGFAMLNCAQGFDVVAGSTGASQIRLRNGSGGNVSLFYGGLQIGTAQSASTATNFTLISNGVAPSVDYADSHYYYSADIVAGNAAPHFRTENGAVIKLYQQSSAGITTVADLVTILQNTGLLS